MQSQAFDLLSVKKKIKVYLKKIGYHLPAIKYHCFTNYLPSLLLWTPFCN